MKTEEQTMCYEDMPRTQENTVAAIRYKPGWSINWHGDEKGRSYIQVAVSIDTEASMNPRNPNGPRTPWRGGKVYLSPHMCRQEIVGAVFGAIQAAEFHEMREWFRYAGASIYNPHLDPMALACFIKEHGKGAFSVREGAMEMAGV